MTHKAGSASDADKKPNDTQIVTSRVLTLMLLLLLLLLAITALNFQFPTLMRANKVMTDFNAFYLTGMMYWDGRLNDAYHFPLLFEAQQKIVGAGSFMPWTYPPPFDLITAVLALMPIGISYCVFVGGSFVAYIVVLHRIARTHTGMVLFAIFPVLALNIRSGQNGFLTGALIGLFLLGYMRGAGGGLALGLMVLKPHLAIGSAVLALVDRGRERIVRAAAAVLGLLAISTYVFGLGVWRAFAIGVDEASRFLSLGLYPMFRMTSVYATLRAAGVAPTICFALQSALAIATCIVIAVAAYRGQDRRKTAGLAAFGSLLVSPYCYDYDLTVLGISAAVFLPDLLEEVGRCRVLLLLALSWTATGSGLVMTLMNEQASGTAVSDVFDQSIGSVALGALALGVYWSLRNPPEQAPT